LSRSCIFLNKFRTPFGSSMVALRLFFLQSKIIS
jgi:hypothetical protein